MSIEPISFDFNYIDVTQKWWQNLNPFSLPFFASADAVFGDYAAESKIYALLNQMARENFTQNPLKNFRKLPIQFVPQNCLPADTAYEKFIADTGKICTRDNVHDLFNGLIWLNYPKTKAVLNQLHTQDILQHGIQATRTPLRNALTLFDENGGLFVSSDTHILQALQNFDWQAALYDKRDCYNNTEFFAFGHALLEKLLYPRKNMCAHTLLISVPQTWFNQTAEQQRLRLDDLLSQVLLTQLQGESTRFNFNAKIFQPLPVLGLPDYSAKQDLAFYQDESVFRPAKKSPPATIFYLNDLADSLVG